jgi:hypothetical protein
MTRDSFLVNSTVAALATAMPAPGAPASMPSRLLASAQAIVRDLAPANNVYGSRPTYVIWSDAAADRVARNRSVCSSFVSHVLERSFGYTSHDIDAWFERSFPQAREYHATIVARRGFARIGSIDAIRPGDVIAIAYPAGSHPTGHVMIAASDAVARIATAPLEAGTRQYEIAVIDSANSGHGERDTRRKADGTWTTGAGRGTLRLYAAPDGSVAGYAWSTSSHSVFRSVADRKVAIGRLDPARVPRPSGRPGTAGAQTEDARGAADDSAEPSSP